MELGYKSYAIAFLIALLTRSSMREQLESPIRTLTFPLDHNGRSPPFQISTIPINEDSSRLENGHGHGLGLGLGLELSPKTTFASLEPMRSRTLSLPSLQEQRRRSEDTAVNVNGGGGGGGLFVNKEDGEDAEDQIVSFKSCQTDLISLPSPSLKSFDEK